MSSVNDDLTIYIDAAGELIVLRSTDYADKYSTLLTAEYYERRAASSLAGTLSVEADDALFDSQPIDQVDANGEPIDELLFSIPDGASVGIINLAWQTIGGSPTNENVGLGYAVIDLENLTSSGYLAFIRTQTPDLLSWSAVPLGTAFVGATDGSGDPLYTANKTFGTFTDDLPETAKFEILDNPDGSRTLRFNATSETADKPWADYQGNGLITWRGAGPLEITGLPLSGSFSHGVEVSPAMWLVDAADLSSLAYIPCLLYTSPSPRDRG